MMTPGLTLASDNTVRMGSWITIPSLLNFHHYLHAPTLYNEDYCIVKTVEFGKAIDLPIVKIEPEAAAIRAHQAVLALLIATRQNRCAVANNCARSLTLDYFVLVASGVEQLTDPTKCYLEPFFKNMHHLVQTVTKFEQAILEPCHHLPFQYRFHNKTTKRTCYLSLCEGMSSTERGVLYASRQRIYTQCQENENVNKQGVSVYGSMSEEERGQMEWTHMNKEQRATDEAMWQCLVNSQYFIHEKRADKKIATIRREHEDKKKAAVAQAVATARKEWEEQTKTVNDSTVILKQQHHTEVNHFLHIQERLKQQHLEEVLRLRQEVKYLEQHQQEQQQQQRCVPTSQHSNETWSPYQSLSSSSSSSSSLATSSNTPISSSSSSSLATSSNTPISSDKMSQDIVEEKDVTKTKEEQEQEKENVSKQRGHVLKKKSIVATIKTSDQSIPRKQSVKRKKEENDDDDVSSEDSESDSSSSSSSDDSDEIEREEEQTLNKIIPKQKDTIVSQDEKKEYVRGNNKKIKTMTKDEQEKEKEKEEEEEKKEMVRKKRTSPMTKIQKNEMIAFINQHGKEWINESHANIVNTILKQYPTITMEQRRTIFENVSCHYHFTKGKDPIFQIKPQLAKNTDINK